MPTPSTQFWGYRTDCVFTKDEERKAVSINEAWVATEGRLLHEASSMAELLVRIRHHISARLIHGEGWERLLERAEETPATMAAFPFGFEIPLQDPAPRADFGVSLVGDSRTAALYQERSRAGEASPSAAGLAWLLDETDREDSLLRHVVGRKMLLEYDIDPSPENKQQDPGVFLYPVKGALAGDGRQIGELGAVHDALAHACGWSSVVSERRQLERVYRMLGPDTLIKAAGAFPSRERAIRIAATGFRTAPEVTAFLERAGWPGDSAIAGSTVSFFEERSAFAYMGVHLDVDANGVGQSLGLSLFPNDKEWLKDIRHWTTIIDVIGEQGYGLPEKLAELAHWSTGSTTLYGKAGPVMLVRGIHHIKLAIREDRVEQAKGYVFFLMMCMQPKGKTAAKPTS